MARILLIDDDAGGRSMAAFNLKKAGHDVDEAETGKAGLEKFRPTHDLVITDVRMPEMTGIEVTRQIHAQAPDVPVFVITAYGNVETAVEAMKAGAFDFVLKPFSRDQLLMTVDKALDRERLAKENRELKRKLAGVEREIVCVSVAMGKIIEIADRVAQSDASVLLTGESGTGKELVARRIHARSPRGDAPFVTVNCAAIPAELIEAELFGHVKGAFTGAHAARAGRFRNADSGTVFLDEVAELPMAIQAKLLGVLQERVVDVVGSDQPVGVDVRIIAATNRDLKAAVDTNAFREDLFFRLNVVEIPVPPLRERPEDVPRLAEHFVKELAPNRELTIPDDVMQALERRKWPGNVRELRNACERAVVLSAGESLQLDSLTPEPADTADGWLELPADGLSLVDLEKRVIERALARNEGNVSATARYLRIPRHILVYRIGKYGLEKPTR